jgi:hypothetical protein
MTPLYRHSGIWTRSVAYLVVVVAAALWGIFELWSAGRPGSSEAQSGALFGVLFLGGSVYAVWQIYNEWRDTIIALDRDPDGKVVATRWSLTGPQKIRGDLRNWRFHVAIVGRNTQAYFIYVDAAALPRPLRLDLSKGADLSGLRTIAPEAVAEFEQATRTGANAS